MASTVIVVLKNTSRIGCLHYAAPLMPVWIQKMHFPAEKGHGAWKNGAENWSNATWMLLMQLFRWQTSLQKKIAAFPAYGEPSPRQLLVPLPTGVLRVHVAVRRWEVVNSSKLLQGAKVRIGNQSWSSKFLTLYCSRCWISGFISPVFLGFWV